MAGKVLMTETVEVTGRGQGGGRSRGFGAEVEEEAYEVETSTVRGQRGYRWWLGRQKRKPVKEEQVMVDLQQHEGILICLGKEGALVTKNLVPRESVYEEQRIFQKQMTKFSTKPITP